MKDSGEFENEYLSLPDEPEIAFAALHRRKYREIEASWEENSQSGWYLERQYVDTLKAFDEIYDLNILDSFGRPPHTDNDFAEFFDDLRRSAEMYSLKILMEEARRQKGDLQGIVVFDAGARESIHKLIDAIRTKLNGLKIPEAKREALFNKLNAFAAEIDRNRTRTEAFFAFAVETARAARQVNDELKPIQQTIDRVLDWIEKARNISQALPPWEQRKRIEGPQKNTSGFHAELDDEFPF